HALPPSRGLLPSPPPQPPAPPTPPVQSGPTASEVAGSLRAQPTPPAAAAAVNKQSPAPVTDAPVAQPARKAVKDAKALPPHKHTKTEKTDTSVAEKEPQGQKSAEALARAALANVDANRPAPNDALIGPGLTDSPAPADIQSRPANVAPRQADVGPPQPVAAPPRAGGIEVAPHAADVQPQPVEISPATGANLQPGARDVRPHPVTPVDIQSRPVAAVDPRSPRAAPPLEISAPQQSPTADKLNGEPWAISQVADRIDGKATAEIKTEQTQRYVVEVPPQLSEEEWVKKYSPPRLPETIMQ